MWKAKKIMRLGIYNTYEMVSAIEFPNTEAAFTKFIQEMTEINDNANATLAKKPRLKGFGGVIKGGREALGLAENREYGESV
jgi:hypothetical protein